MWVYVGVLLEGILGVGVPVEGVLGVGVPIEGIVGCGCGCGCVGERRGLGSCWKRGVGMGPPGDEPSGRGGVVMTPNGDTKRGAHGGRQRFAYGGVDVAPPRVEARAWLFLEMQQTEGARRQVMVACRGMKWAFQRCLLSRVYAMHPYHLSVEERPHTATAQP